MADLGSMLNKLTREEVAVNPADPHKVDEKFNACMGMVGQADSEGQYTPHQMICIRLLLDAIFIAHQIRCPHYKLEEALKALSRLQAGLGSVTKFLVENRPKVDMVGLVSGTKVMPVAFQSDQEATAYRDVIQTAMGNGAEMIHLINVELTTSSVNAALQPMVAEAIIPLKLPPKQDPLTEDLEAVLKGEDPPVILKQPVEGTHNG